MFLKYVKNKGKGYNKLTTFFNSRWSWYFMSTRKLKQGGQINYTIPFYGKHHRRKIKLAL